MRSLLAAVAGVAAFTTAPCAIHAQRPIDPETIVRDWKTVNRQSAVVD